MRGEWFIWAICAVAVAGVLLRPKQSGEWLWAGGGALALVAFRLISPAAAGTAIARGTDVYLFLTGMMLLAELARREGLFDWAAIHAVRASKGSRFRLFALLYTVGIVVTVVLSNDATAVVLTPAVIAAVRAAKVDPLPYLFACAFIANAASFVLPISNPANLVVFANAMPALAHWLALFSLPSFAAIATTFALLALTSHASLRGAVDDRIDARELSSGGRIALLGIAFTAAVLTIGSAKGAPLGMLTCACGVLVLIIAGARSPRILREVPSSLSWSVLLLVAGLFVLVEGLDHTSFLQMTRRAFAMLAEWPTPFSLLAAAALTGIASNLTNNLPAALIAGTSIAPQHQQQAFHAAVALGIDLGPNLSVTGSLATVLWLIALRREGMDVSSITFLKTGAVVMPPALLFASLALWIVSR